MRKKPELSLRTRALRYLARREHSRAELQGKLLRSLQRADEAETVPDVNQALEAVLDTLEKQGLLSDHRTAAQLIHSKRNRYGTQRIVHELRQKGIAEILISDALPEMKETELDAARTVWRKRFAHLPADAQERAKQTRFLQSRGFSLEVIFKLLKSPLDGELDD